MHISCIFLTFLVAFLKLVLHPVVRGNYEWFACKNGPRSTMHAGGKYFFWKSQTRRRARSLKTGRPVFRYDLTATICTPGTRKIKVLRKFDRCACNAGKHATISGYFPHESVLTTQEAPTLHLLSLYVLTKGGWTHFLSAFYQLSKCLESTTIVLVKYVTPRRRTCPVR